jgi:hypothetical protein
MLRTPSEQNGYFHDSLKRTTCSLEDRPDVLQCLVSLFLHCRADSFQRPAAWAHGDLSRHEYESICYDRVRVR